MPLGRLILPLALIAGYRVALPGQSNTAGADRGAIQGLDKLVGFRRDGGPTALLPPTVAPQALYIDKPGFEDGMEVRDFEIAGFARGTPTLLLRQVMNRNQPRITTQWWGLYENNARLDCWYFAPYGNPEDKLLTPYEIDRISMEPSGVIAFHTHGSMHRPGGRGWMQGKDLVFTASGGRLKLQSVRSNFFFSYQNVDHTGAVSLLTERVIEVNGERRVEIREFKEVPERLLQKCGYQDPLESDLGDKEYFRGLERAAVCLGGAPPTKTCYRGINEPSFVERGGKPASCGTAN